MLFGMGLFWTKAIVNEYFEVIGVSSPGEDLTELRHREKINTFSIEMNRQISVLKDVRSLIKIFF